MPKSAQPIEFDPNGLEVWPPPIRELEVDDYVAPRKHPIYEYLVTLDSVAAQQDEAAAINRKFSESVAKMREARPTSPPRPEFIRFEQPEMPLGFVQPVRVAVHYDDGRVRRYPLSQAKVEDQDYSGNHKALVYEPITMQETRTATIVRVMAETEDGAELCDMLEKPMYVMSGTIVNLSPKIMLVRG